MTVRLLAAVAAAAVLAAGCASTPAPYPTTAVSPQHALSATAHPAAGHHKTRHKAHRGNAHARRPTRVPAGVPMPNRSLTPGSIQSSDTAAICTPGWAEAHRDVSYATKDQVAAEYGLASRYGYEIDHLIPLELGGANAITNLWPQPYNSRYGANQKDGLEDYLHDQVCYHGLALATAQHEIAVNWFAAWVAAGRPLPSDFGYGTAPAPSTAPGSAPGSAPTPGSASCTVSASYNATYHDYDVYVHSNQPDRTVTVSASGGASKTWHTDSSGYADVYLDVTGNPAGQTVTVTVGGASCSTTLG